MLLHILIFSLLPPLFFHLCPISLKICNHNRGRQDISMKRAQEVFRSRGYQDLEWISENFQVLESLSIISIKIFKSQRKDQV